jgi:fructose-bisphosphate aldolase, class II
MMQTNKQTNAHSHSSLYFSLRLTLIEYPSLHVYHVSIRVYSSSTCNAVLEAAKRSKSPVIIQVSNGGGAFMAGKGYKGADAAVVGSVALAMHVRSVAKYYGVPVILHSDHCAKSLLPWFDGMLAADEDFYKKFGEPLYGSHMLDLSEEPDAENIGICVEYFKRMVPMKIWLEMEIGITGGEEDGVNNEHVDPEKLYTSPEQVYAVYDALSKIGDMFSIAAAFGNVHGVYKPGNVVLSPERLGKHQEYAKRMLNATVPKPIFLVMHGGSGSTDDEIMTAVKNGVVKMNIDTDSKYIYNDGGDCDGSRGSVCRIVDDGGDGRSICSNDCRTHTCTHLVRFIIVVSITISVYSSMELLGRPPQV